MDLRQYAVVEPQHGHRAVLQPLPCEEGRLAHADRFDRLGAKDEAQSISVVHDDVKDGPAARRRPVDAPALYLWSQVDRVEYACEQRSADRAGLHQLTYLAMRGRIAQVMIGGHHNAGVTAGGNHPPRVGQRQREWLLAQSTCFPAAAAASTCSQ